MTKLSSSWIAENTYTATIVAEADGRVASVRELLLGTTFDRISEDKK